MLRIFNQNLQPKSPPHLNQKNHPTVCPRYATVAKSCSDLLAYFPSKFPSLKQELMQMQCHFLFQTTPNTPNNKHLVIMNTEYYGCKTHWTHSKYRLLTLWTLQTESCTTCHCGPSSEFRNFRICPHTKHVQRHRTCKCGTRATDYTKPTAVRRA